jgi:quercetin dioxygenase-like cupin family protein
MTTENFCFCELAPLYALDRLSEEERLWVEQQILEEPDLAEELAAYQSAVTAIPYGVPDVPVPKNLKDRLFNQLGLETPEADPPPEPKTYLGVRSQDLNWQPHPAPGVSIAIIRTDEIKRELVGFLRVEPRVRYPLHFHAGMEEILMLEGDLRVDEQVYVAGDYILSYPGSSHAPYSHEGCRFFFHASMDDEFLELIAANC